MPCPPIESSTISQRSEWLLDICCMMWCLLFSLFSLGAVDELGDMPYYAEHCAAMLAVTYSSGQGMQRNIVRAIYIREVPHMLCGTKLVSNKMPSRNLRWSDHLDLWIKFGFMYCVDNKMAAVMWFKRWSFVVDGEIFEFDPLKIDIILRTGQRRCDVRLPW